MNEKCCDYDSQRSSIKSERVTKRDSTRNKIVNEPEATLEIEKAILEIMKPAPSWSGVAIADSKIVNISLKDYRGKYLAMVFYPYDFTLRCPTELLQFSDRVDEFDALDCKVVTVSTDSEFTHLAWSTTPRKQGGLGQMRLTMLSDKSHGISKIYGVYDSSMGISYRGLFVIDRDGILRHVTINDIAISRNVDEVLRVIEASRFVDEHGDICPMGPKPDVQNPNSSYEKSQDYFSADLIDSKH